VGKKPYLSIASSLDRMTYNIEGILDGLRAKSQNHILFSDQAVKEVNDVFQEAMRLLENLPNLVTTRDKLLAQRIGEEGRVMLKIANGYSEVHEERLIQGICVPKSSPIYLGMIESLKGVIVHILEVSGKIVAVSSKNRVKDVIRLILETPERGSVRISLTASFFYNMMNPDS